MLNFYFGVPSIRHLIKMHCSFPCNNILNSSVFPVWVQWECQWNINEPPSRPSSQCIVDNWNVKIQSFCHQPQHLPGTLLYQYTKHFNLLNRKTKNVKECLRKHVWKKILRRRRYLNDIFCNNVECVFFLNYKNLTQTLDWLFPLWEGGCKSI